MGRSRLTYLSKAESLDKLVAGFTKADATRRAPAELATVSAEELEKRISVGATLLKDLERLEKLLRDGKPATESREIVRLNTLDRDELPRLRARTQREMAECRAELRRRQ